MNVFYLKQKVFSLRDHYEVFDDNKSRHYYCKGRFFSATRSLELFDNNDALLYRLRKKRFSFRPTFYLYDKDSNQVAKTVKRRSLFKQKVTIESTFGDMLIKGNYWAHDFYIEFNGEAVASMHKKRLTWGDTYEVIIHDRKNIDFYMALMIMVDSKFHKRKRKSSNSRGIRSR